jgi:hypothetical protein
MYKGYPESKFWWAIEKKSYFKTIYIAIWCTYRTLIFDVVPTIVEELVIAGASVFVAVHHRMMPPVMLTMC